MRTKVAALVLALGLLAPALSFAQTTDVSAQIAALLTQIQQLEQLIAQLKGQTSSSCVTLSNNLTLGASGSDVTNLQNYLIAKGDLAPQYNTGYYGYLTASAVGKLQLSLGLVSSANDSNYGIVDAGTRSAISIGCSNVHETLSPPPSISFSANPTSGVAPLAVMFTSPDSYREGTVGGTVSIDYGDGSGAQPVYCTSAQCPSVTLQHTYSSAGTYHVVLSRWSSAPPIYGSATQTVGTATITVTGGQTSSPSISLSSPTNGATYQIGNAIPITWNYSGAPANSQVILGLSLVQASASTGYTSGGGWQSTALSSSGFGTGSYSWQTGSGGYLDIPGIYRLSAKMRSCDAAGCNYSYASDASLPTLATAAPVQLTITSPSVQASATIDQADLVRQAGTFEIAGSAQNTNDVVVDLVPSGDTAIDYNTVSNEQMSGKDGFYTSSAGVNGGRWVSTFQYNNAGTFTVVVYDFYTHTILTTGALTVQGTMALGICPANALGQRGQNGQQYSCFCPQNFQVRPIWGGPGGVGTPGYYTDDSDICTAAVQDGQTNSASGGQIDYTIEPGQNYYYSFTQNGITSQSWGTWPGSFAITGPKACLAEGTAIAMSDGSHKNIEDIHVGDRVQSFDGGKIISAVVTNVIQREDPIVTINGTLKAAPDEVVYLANGKTETVDQLQVGDQLQGEQGRSVNITSITRSSALAKTYDLELENGSSFFADGYLVQSLNQ